MVCVYVFSYYCWLEFLWVWVILWGIDLEVFFYGYCFDDVW